MNPDISETGVETLSAAEPEAVQEAVIKLNQTSAAKKAMQNFARTLLNAAAPLNVEQLDDMTDAFHSKRISVLMASLFTIGKKAMNGDTDALDYLINAAGNAGDGIWGSGF